MATRLDPNGARIQIGTVWLETPGLEGQVEVRQPLTGETRSADLPSTFDEALIAAEMSTQQVIEISETRQLPVPEGAGRTTRSGDAAVVVGVEDPGPDYGQCLLVLNEAGALEWHFPEQGTEAPELAPDRSGGTRTYVLPLRVPEPPPETAARGPGGWLGKKVLRVLVFPLVRPLVGVAGRYFVRKWEENKRPYRVREFGPGNYNDNEDPPLINSDRWRQLGGGDALLFVHGTFSRAASAFGALSDDLVRDLHTSYEGRVFALDHYTLTEDPRENIDWLVNRAPDGQRLPQDASLNLDVVCHSRGGLIARMLAERAADVGVDGRLGVRSVIFVATPNAGTALADTRHLKTFIDTYTNLLKFIPGAAGDIIEGVVMVAKELAVTIHADLPGLQSMNPGGPFLRQLNSRSGLSPLYRAIAADYQPVDGGLVDYATNEVVDAVFQRKPNDLVVPTAGVYDANGADSFPIPEDSRYTFPATDGAAHTAFFGRAKSQELLRQWLLQVAPAGGF